LITHLADTVTAHLLRGSPPNPTTATTDRSPGANVALRRRIRRHLAEAVVAGHLDIDHANAILQHLDLRQLRRRWQVRIQIPVAVTLTAANEDVAYVSAMDQIMAALHDIGDIHVEATNCQRLDVLPTDFEPDKP
jgi:hypothetical protein